MFKQIYWSLPVNDPVPDIAASDAKYFTVLDAIKGCTGHREPIANDFYYPL